MNSMAYSRFAVFIHQIFNKRRVFPTIPGTGRGGIRTIPYHACMKKVWKPINIIFQANPSPLVAAAPCGRPTTGVGQLRPTREGRYLHCFRACTLGGFHIFLRRVLIFSYSSDQQYYFEYCTNVEYRVYACCTTQTINEL